MREEGHEPATRGALCGVRDEVRGELRGVRDELRGEIRGVRDELRGRLDAHDRRFDGIDGNLRRLNLGFVRIEGDMSELKGKVDSLMELKADFSQFKTNIERMTSYFEGCVRKMDSQGSMLMEHEGRIKRLETRFS